MLGDALLTRFETAAEGTLTQLSPGELRFERLLRDSSPAQLSPALFANLESIVRDVPFPVDEKILLFPKASVRTHRTRPIWGAAAAVALIGAATAFMIPTGKAPVNSARQAARTSSPVTASASPSLVPASFNRGLSEVHDEGVVWKSNNQPHTVVRVVYKDMITLKDANGRTIQVERPRVEYMLVPAKTD
jgi:hypothetical protein